MDQLLSHFSGKGIPAAESERIASAFIHKKIGKDEYFTEEGKISRYLAFVTKGLFRYYYVRDGEEITTYVSGANSFLVSLASFFKQQPSREYISALTDAELLVIGHKELQQLKAESDGFKGFYMNALENLAVGMDETRTNLIILSAEERYALLVEREPELLQKIPLQYLASILGVTPRHLSRIRNNFR